MGRENMLNDVLKGVLYGGIPLGTAINNDARAQAEHEQNMRINEAREARAKQEFDFNLSLAQRKEAERLDAQKFQILQGVLDANGGDVDAMLASPQAGIVAADLLSSDPAMQARIGSNGAKPKAFVPASDGKGYVLMVDKDGQVAPLTQDRTAGTPAVKFTHEEMAGILAGRAAALGVGDGFSTAINAQSLSAAAKMAPSPDRIPYAANLGVIPTNAGRVQSRATVVADNSPSAQKPVGPAPSTPVEKTADGTPASIAPIPANPERMRAHGKDWVKDSAGNWVLPPEDRTQGTFANNVQPVDETQRAAQETAAAAPAATAGIRRAFQQEVGAQKHGAVAPEDTSSWRVKLFGQSAPEQASVVEPNSDTPAATRLGQMVRKAYDTASQKIGEGVQAVKDNPTRLIPAASTFNFINDMANKSDTVAAAKDKAVASVKQAASDFKRGFSPTVDSVAKDSGVYVNGATTDDDLKSPKAAVTPPSHGGEPANKTERQLADGRLAKSTVEDPQRRSYVEKEIEAQLAQSTPQERIAGNAVALSSFNPNGGAITARQRYAAMRLYKAGAISGEMLGNFMQSGRYSFDDVHAAASMVQAQASMMRARQAAANDDARLRLEYAKLRDEGAVKEATALIKQVDDAKKDINDAISAYSQTGVGVMGASGAAKFYGATDAKGNLQPEAASKIWASQMRVALLDPDVRAALNGDANGEGKPVPYYAVNSRMLDNLQRLLTGYNQDPANRKLFKQQPWWSMSGDDAGAVPSSGGFVRWLKSGSGRKFMELQRIQDAGGSQPEQSYGEE